MGTILLASILSFGAPNLLRTLGAAPAVISLAIVGLHRVEALVRRRWGRRAASLMALGWLAWFAAAEPSRYFLEWSQRADVWDDFSGREYIAANLVRSIPPGDFAAVFEGWLEHDAFLFMTHGRPNLAAVPREPLPHPGARALHVIMLTEIPAMRPYMDEVRAISLPGHRMREETLRLPDGRPFGAHVIFEPVGPADE
jgi:hypothetical protein